MKIIDIGKQALSTLWTHKYLWFFGFFVAAGSGARGEGGGTEPVMGSAGHPFGSPADFPPWAWGLIALGLVVGVVFLILHILSEAALIRGVADGQQGQGGSIRERLRQSRPHFWTLVGLKLVLGFVAVVSMALMAVPGVLTHLGLLPLWLGVILTVALLLPGIPWLLTVYFTYEYALRIAVLEARSVGDAIAGARRFLRGRVGASIWLTLLAFAGQLGSAIVLGLSLIPGAIVGLLVYLLAGMIPAVIVGGVVALPLATMAMGAAGTFRSSVWTLGYIRGQQEAEA